MARTGPKKGKETASKKKKKSRDKAKEKRKKKKAAYGCIKDLVISVVVVLIIMGSLYAYSGVWPPMVVVESGSMMHGDDGEIGIIDTGDLTIVKSIGARKDVVSWVEGNRKVEFSYRDTTGNHLNNEMKGKRATHETYGDHGDVIIFRKNGVPDTTPVIHRAIVWIEYDDSCPDNSYRASVPDLDLTCIDQLTLHNFASYKDLNNIHGDLIINFNIIFNLDLNKRSGWLTHGDHNQRQVDEGYLSDDGPQRRPLGPVTVDHVVGLSVGELPWFGIIKLQMGPNPPKIPPSSWNGLFITIFLFIFIPILIDFIWAFFRKRREIKKKEKEEEEDEEEEEPDGEESPDEDDLPGEEDDEFFEDEFDDMAADSVDKSDKKK
jgi:signal peptidase